MEHVYGAGSGQSSAADRRQLRIGTAQREIAAELDVPPTPSAWAVMSYPRQDERSGVLMSEWMRASAHARGIATLMLEPASGSIRNEAERLRCAAGWLRDHGAGDHPVHLLVGGRSLAAALRCDTADITSVVSWNGRPGLFWRKPSPIRPTLLMLGAGARRRMTLMNRLAYVRLGRHAHLMRATGNAAAAERIASWLQQPLPLRPAGVRLDRRTRRQLAGGAAALALSLPLSLQPGVMSSAAPRPTQIQSLAGHDPFADGVTVAASGIRGDGLAVAAQAPNVQRRSRTRAFGPRDIPGDGLTPGRLATGSANLIDGGGLEWFVNTNITFATSSSASGAASEASFTGPVAATTLNGGTLSTTLNDSFDGYNSLCFNVNGVAAPCEIGNANFAIYNQNGPATFACAGREVRLPTQTIGALDVSRRVYVPSNDTFARWLNIVTNTSGAPTTVTMTINNNIGSDANTKVVTTSSGDAAATVDDAWVTTFQNFSGTTSSDPRLGHVLRSAASPPLAAISFADGDDNPFWSYQFTLQPGETGIIMDLATAQPSRAAAAAKAAELAAGPASIYACMTPTEQSQVRNFSSADLSVVVTDGVDPVGVGGALSYTVDVANAGPASATNVVVAATLPSGSSYVGASGTGWVCSEAAGVVTCTLPSLAIGAAAPIAINTTAPTTAGNASLSVTVASNLPDGSASNNSATASTVVQLFKQSLALVAVAGQPDLAVTSVTLTPNQTTFQAGAPVEVAVTVTNQGTATTSPFWVDMYLNPSAEPTVNQTWNLLCQLTPCYGVAWGVTTPLAPGESITLRTTVDSYAAGQTFWEGTFASGTTRLVVLADSYNPASSAGNLVESNEANNTASVSLIVTGASPAGAPITPALPALPERPAQP